MTNKAIQVVGGGTVSHVSAHLALSAPAYGSTARKIAELCWHHAQTKMDVNLHLTKMAHYASIIETNEDLEGLARRLTKDPRTKIVFWNPAVVDFDGHIIDVTDGTRHERPRGKREQRLETAREGTPNEYCMRLRPSARIVSLFRQGGTGVAARKDIFLVAFKTTTNATEKEQFRAGLNLLKSVSANLVLANDVVTRRNMIIVPEEAPYSVTISRDLALTELVDMAIQRSHLTFTRSTVVAGDPVPWDSELVPASLRAVVDHCIERGAYKRFRGVTAGHFAVKIDDTTFLTSRRKTDFNDMKHVGLVKVTTDGPDSVIAYGSKPSVGGQSQRIIFKEHEGADCIVHFHCPKKPGSLVPTVSQREYECGSHECGANTSRGLERFGNLLAVYLDNHGPNIVFNRGTDPREVIDFIEANFDLALKSDGYQVA